MIAGVVGGETFCATAWMTVNEVQESTRTVVSKARTREFVSMNLRML
jgi:hypothetical protein